MTDKVNAPQQLPSLEQVISIMECILQGEDPWVIRIPPQWSPPCWLEKMRCIYVLELQPRGEKKDDNNSESRKYYVGSVGKTKSVLRRFEEHRAGGRDWAQAAGVAVSINGKDNCNFAEDKLTRMMKRRGFDMIDMKRSVKDIAATS